MEETRVGRNVETYRHWCLYINGCRPTTSDSALFCYLNGSPSESGNPFWPQFSSFHVLNSTTIGQLCPSIPPFLRDWRETCAGKQRPPVFIGLVCLSHFKPFQFYYMTATLFVYRLSSLLLTSCLSPLSKLLLRTKRLPSH